MSSVLTPDGPRPLSAIRFRDAANVLRSVKALKVRDAGNILRGSVSSSLEVSLSADFVSGAVNSSVARDITTRSVTVSASGGVQPYAYSWLRTDLGSDAWTINGAATDTASFTAIAVAPGEEFSGAFTPTVRDALGNHVVAPAVSASAINISSGGGGPLP